MEELFRFMMLRPADLAPPTRVRTLTPSFVERGSNMTAARRSATQFVGGNAFVRVSFGLTYRAAADAALTAVRRGTNKAADVAQVIQRAAGRTPAEIVADERFKTERARIEDSLVAMKLLSGSVGGDAPGIESTVLGYDIIQQAADGHDPVIVRSLVYDLSAHAKDPAPPQPGKPPAQPPAQPPDHGPAIARIDAAINALSRLQVAAFVPPVAAARPGAPAVAVPAAPRPAAPAEPRPAAQILPASFSAGAQPWLLHQQSVAGLDAQVRQTVAATGLDLTKHALPIVLDTLHQQRVQLERSQAVDEAAGFSDVVHRIGGIFKAVRTNDYVGPPGAPAPTGHGNVRPVGIGDLLMVKQHVLRYEGGDLAHVENILKSEHLERDTRRLERTETTITQETETTKEEEQDTQTTDRFSLKRETSDTIKNDSSFKAGVSVDAKYGPFVEVKANADFATSTSSESSAKQASEFSKDVVSRSASKLVERVLERRTTTTITEFEEKYSHGFDNTQGAGHISGFYQWIDKVMQAQVYNYGKRMLFDVTVPEPGTNFILTQTANTDQGQNLTAPPPFTIRADQTTEGNYTVWAKNYDVTGLEPPPPPWQTVTKSIDGMFSQDPHEGSKSESIAVPDGYRAKWAQIPRAWITYDGAFWGLTIGTNYIDGLDPNAGHLDMAGEVGSVGFGYIAYKMEGIAGSLEVFCERTDTAFHAWQLKAHAGITQGYQAKQQQYEQALAQAKAAAGTVIAGKNPAFNLRLINAELRRQCLALVTGQQFDSFGALELTAEGYAQPNLAATDTQMPYVRFFEQAFEWEHLVYFYYPYFWGWKPAWKEHMLLDDTDPEFGDFLRAGAARVVFPVRPGFEEAVAHYLETGEIWNGGPPPTISSPLYVSIITEIQEATGAPGDETPVGDPWLVHLPTTLVQIRPNNDLPVWKKVGEDWQAAN
ncbi:MAG TPA: hypothetical protein VH855_05950 [Acetobacteraceae bacterium]|jgi:hypothetical protein